MSPLLAGIKRVFRPTYETDTRTVNSHMYARWWMGVVFCRYLLIIFTKKNHPHLFFLYKSGRFRFYPFGGICMRNYHWQVLILSLWRYLYEKLSLVWAQNSHNELLPVLQFIITDHLFFNFQNVGAF
jgi:hypothetical protein